MGAYNNYSKELQAILDEARPKEWNKVVFESLSGSMNLPKTDTIIDPGTKKKINIAILNGYRPNKNEESNRSEIPNFGRASFLASSANKILVYGGKPEDEDLFDFLFLCRWNKDNKDQKWHIRPNGNRYRFMSSDVERKQEEAVSREERVLEAKNEIRKMNFDQAKEVYSKISTSYKELSLNGIKQRLYELAEKDPDKACGKTIDEKAATSVVISDLQDYGILKKAPGLWLSVNGEGGKDEKLVGIPPGTNAVEFLMDFLKDPKNEKERKLLEEKLKVAKKEAKK